MPHKTPEGAFMFLFQNRWDRIRAGPHGEGGRRQEEGVCGIESESPSAEDFFFNLLFANYVLLSRFS